MAGDPAGGKVHDGTCRRKNPGDGPEPGRAERDPREREEIFRTLAEFSSDWVFWRDGGRMLYVSPACETISGYAPEEFHRDPRLFYSIVHPEDRESWAGHCREVEERPAPSRSEFRIVTRRGETRWIDHVCRPVRSGQGTVLGILGSNRDVSEKRRLEEEFRKTATLESIGILAGGIAHDFNNIVTAILGNISLGIRELPHGSPVRKRLEEAEEACLRAKQVTGQLLTFASGGAPVRSTASVGDLVREAAGFSTRGSNVRCLFQIPEELWPVEIDAGQIGQVIGNLVINACQAMPEGGIVRVGADNVALEKGNPLSLPGGRYVRLSVRDHGAGIPKENLEKIFTPFFTTKEAGTGLGLATCHSIVRRHEGAIEVRSAEGKGSVFHVYLPASRREIPRSRPEAPLPPEGKGRVLVMDDEESVRAVASEILRALGYEAVAVRDGEGALFAYRRALEEGAPFDAVLLDLTIPGGMGGRETIRALLDLDPGVRGIVSSGYSNDPVMSAYREHGFRGVIPKPYRVSELGKVLREVLAGREEIPA